MGIPCVRVCIREIDGSLARGTRKTELEYMHVAWGSINVTYTKEGCAGIHARSMGLD